MSSYVFEPLRLPALNSDMASQTCASGAAISFSSFSVSVVLNEPDADLPVTMNDDLAIAARLPSLEAAVDFLQQIR